VPLRHYNLTVLADKQHDTFENALWGYNSKFAAVSHYIAKTVKDRAKIIIEHEVICNLLNNVISNDPE